MTKYIPVVGSQLILKFSIEVSQLVERREGRERGERGGEREEGERGGREQRKGSTVSIIHSCRTYNKQTQ